MGLARHLALLAAVSLGLSACANVPDDTTPPVKPEPLNIAQGQLAENTLLNVWIERFDYAEVDQEEAEETGTSAEIRKAESRFIPVHLKDTLQATGRFGAVRVVPQSVVGGEVLVSGRIIESSGRRVALEVTAEDAMGRQWFERSYESEIVPANYDRLQPGHYDAFQPLYNKIANDLIEELEDRSAKAVKRIRQAAKLKFAEFIAPKVFEDYLEKEEDGRVRIQRLPAENDPLFQRVESLRARNAMLADTLNSHYEQFYRNMWEPYTNWRKESLREILALERVEQEAAAKKLGGIGAILGAIALGAAGGEVADRTGALQNVMVAGGALAVKSGMDQSGESEIHESSIKELGNSFENEIEPMNVEIGDETVELTGSAEAQFARWRELLHERYESQRGLTDPASEGETGSDAVSAAPQEPSSDSGDSPGL